MYVHPNSQFQNSRSVIFLSALTYPMLHKKKAISKEKWFSYAFMQQEQRCYRHLQTAAHLLLVNHNGKGEKKKRETWKTDLALTTEIVETFKLNT